MAIRADGRPRGHQGDRAARHARSGATTMTDSLTDAQKGAITQNIPLSCLGQPEDVANAVQFLATPASAYITGQVLGVNGGLYI